MISLRLWRGGIFNDHFITGLLLSPVMKKMLKIGQRLANLLARVGCPVFYSRGSLSC